ncbi:hypothetical protein F5887DRAFT_958157 [Amanita rubescens]|nr:hypothetical protein F5887DRAFT_962223 [Amanita rubescens]KAF8346825.1 hypothetical protein F5887DRAFT_958157 [Amanita rubescens]
MFHNRIISTVMLRALFGFRPLRCFGAPQSRALLWRDAQAFAEQTHETKGLMRIPEAVVYNSYMQLPFCAHAERYLIINLCVTSGGFRSFEW